MKAESLGTSYLAIPEGTGSFPGVVVVHEAFGLNDNIRDICDRLTVHDQGKVLDQGDVETIQRSPKVQQVFTTRV